jgi:hypothetical protein
MKSLYAVAALAAMSICGSANSASTDSYEGRNRRHGRPGGSAYMSHPKEAAKLIEEAAISLHVN